MSLGDYMKHKVMCKTEQEELVYENWLRLGECIVTPKLKHMNHYISVFFDKKEEKKNLKKIEYIRSLGAMTDTEYEMWLHDFKKKMNNTRSSCGPKTKVTNKYAGTEKIYRTLKEACEDNDISYFKIKKVFKEEQSKITKYQGLIIEKLI